MKTDKESVSIIKSEWSEDGLLLRQSADLAVDRERIAKRESGVTESVTGSRYQRGQSYKCSRVVFEIFRINPICSVSGLVVFLPQKLYAPIVLWGVQRFRARYELRR